MVALWDTGRGTGGVLQAQRYCKIIGQEELAMRKMRNVFGKQAMFSAEKRKAERRRTLALAVGMAVFLSGCGTGNGSSGGPEEMSGTSASAVEASNGTAGTESADTSVKAMDNLQEGTESSGTLWTEESVPTISEWAASALAEAEAGDLKEQTEDFLAGVQGLSERFKEGAEYKPADEEAPLDEEGYFVDSAMMEELEKWKQENGAVGGGAS